MSDRAAQIARLRELRDAVRAIAREQNNAIRLLDELREQVLTTYLREHRAKCEAYRDLAAEIDAADPMGRRVLEEVEQ